MNLLPVPILFSVAAAACGAATLAAQTALPTPVERIPATPPFAFDHVVHGAADADTLWAGGRDWKAAFGRDGFTFVPFLGADAPQNQPVTFRVAAVRVAGRDVAIDRDARPSRDGDRITFARGPLRERYDLTPAHVAQSFELDPLWPGDVDVELRVTTSLAEDLSQPGWQWTNERGGVGYGDAFVVRDGATHAIATTWNGDVLRLHVPAALRGDGPLLIDPIVSTVQMGFTPTFARPSRAPDVAYDVTGNVYLVVWESLFSATDIDVLCEMLDGDGNRILGSGAALDFTAAVCSQPSVADCNLSNRFLLAMTRADPALHQGRAMIVGCTRDASPAAPLSAEFPISNPQFGSGQHTGADIGGDSGATPGAPGALGFVVVWTHSPAGNSTVQSRFFTPAGAPAAPAQQLIGGPAPLHSPRISSGNGRGHVPEPGWLIVLSQTSPNDQDVMYLLLTSTGQTVNFGNIDNDFGDDRYPHVSTPITNLAGTRTWFLVTYEQQAPAAARAVVLQHGTLSLLAPTDLTTTFGFGPQWLRAEGDGVRFAVTSSVPIIVPGAIGVGTLAFDGQSLLRHEGPRVLAGTPSYPRLTSTYASGGAALRYAVAHVDASLTPAATSVALYSGHQPGVQIAQHTIACGGLSLQWAGQPLLTNTMQFTLANFAGDLPAIAFGAPAAAPVPLCPNCALGLRTDVPILLQFASVLALPIPPNIALVGATFGIQGVAIGQGTCLGALRLSDMFEITLR